MIRIKGKAVSPGIVMGKAMLYNFAREVIRAGEHQRKVGGEGDLAPGKRGEKIPGPAEKDQPATCRRSWARTRPSSSRPSTCCSRTATCSTRSRPSHPGQAGQGRMGHQGNRKKIPGDLPHHPRPFLQGQEQRHLRRAEPPDRQPEKRQPRVRWPRSPARSSWSPTTSPPPRRPR